MIEDADLAERETLDCNQGPLALQKQSKEIVTVSDGASEVNESLFGRP